jgi:hypothetical protein
MPLAISVPVGHPGSKWLGSHDGYDWLRGTPNEQAFKESQKDCLFRAFRWHEFWQ